MSWGNTCKYDLREKLKQYEKVWSSTTASKSEYRVYIRFLRKEIVMLRGEVESLRAKLKRRGV